jgi:hypothetical protein
VIITVPYTGANTSLAINLTNNLTFTTASGSVNTVPTSLMIVGQLGGGLGSSPSRVMVQHNNTTNDTQTWPVANSGNSFTPPTQIARVQSFGTEVAVGTPQTLNWTSLKPGTYLLESGTHPSIQGPMGLIGMLVVTQAPSGTTPGVAYTAASGPVNYNAEVPLLFSEIDPVQNSAVANAVNTAGFSETAVWNGQAGQCGSKLPAPGASGPNPLYGTCYPPAVNYSPLYYLINGVAFNKTNPSGSLFSAVPGSSTNTITGNVLVRFVNAGSRMHVPSIVGSTIGQGVGGNPPPGGFQLIAEDGNPVPGTPRIQSDVFMAAGKTYDVMINALPVGSTTAAPITFPVFDRELSLSGNAINRDSGMLAYIGVNGGTLPNSGVFAASGAKANADSFSSIIANHTFTISDPSKGVIANDVNIFGVTLAVPPTQASSFTLNPDGTFTYTASSSWSTSDSFTYCGNGTVLSAGATTLPSTCAVVTLGPAAIESASGITVTNHSYTSPVATLLGIKNPGILLGAVDTAGYPLTVTNVQPASITGVTPIAPCTGVSTTNCVAVNPDGSFNAYPPAPGTYAFTFQAQNTQGTVSSGASGTGTVTLTFLQGSGLKVSVVDGTDKTTPITDYRWIIEEDKTMYINPACQVNPLPAGCPQYTTGSGPSIAPMLGVNFHTSNMPFVAQGCVGPLSCENGQTVLDPNTGLHSAAVCDQGNGICRTTAAQETPVDPSQVYLDPTKRYYISILPGDAANSFNAGYTGGACQNGAANSGGAACGHGMGGASLAAGQTSVTILSQPNPYPPGELSVFVFEDDFPLNGEVDSGGGVDVLAPNEPGLGSFQIHLWDAMGQNGDFTGQMTYDMFNQPLSNALAGVIDPANNGINACPISPSSSTYFNGASISATANGAGNVITPTGITVDNNQVGATVTITGGTNFTAGTYTVASVNTTAGTWTLTPAVTGSQAATGIASGMTGTSSESGITGMVVTCPKYEADGTTLSPLAGQAVIKNLMPGRFGVIATPAADRIARGEEWLQTNTLDGQKAHDSFIKIGEPSYFQEYGPANFHVTVGFANPKIINNRLASVCAGTDVYLPGQGNCTYTIKGKVTGERLSRTPDERLYSSGSHDAFYWTQCYVSVGDPDGEDFAFTKCNADGTFQINGLPQGSWRVTTFDQWNDQLVDGLSTPVALSGNNPLIDMGDIATTQWQTNIYTRTFIDDNKDGVYQSGEGGVPFLNVAIRYRDGSMSNLLSTDFDGIANFNETFPLFAWYTIETDVTRYKNTGTHVVYDAGGPADGSTSCGQVHPGYPNCGTSTAYNFLANTNEAIPLPNNLRVPGSVYCDKADCGGLSIATGPEAGGSSGPGGSTGRIDAPWVETEAWQGFPGQNEFVEFAKAPYATGENGGIKGHVVYASTRPFDDPQMLVQTQWEPLVPGVRINLYQEGTAPDGTKSLTLVDWTTTSSWDDFVQGVRTDANGNPMHDAQGNGIPNMSCPGQTTSDLFYFTLQNQPEYLDFYNSEHATQGVLSTPSPTALPYNSQYKCYDGMHNWNQVQPAPYDGMYSFPSVTAMDPVTGKPTKTNCTICIQNPTTSSFNSANPSAFDPYRTGLPMLPQGKYVVEVVVPPGFELVKEEDKNILIGDNFIAPVTQEFGGLGNVFILPDQATVASNNNPYNPQNPTDNLGASPENGIVPAFTPEPLWPCVGASRVVPDYISLFPQSQQVAPFAGATRNLCDRKEVTLTDQMAATAKFYVFTSTHKASKFYGGITDDFTSEFDPFSPAFGEKFAPPNLPVAVRDFTGAEVSRVYADAWGQFNGMTYSTWEVNPPNPTGYSPSMMVMCMNDPGPLQGTNAQPILNASGQPTSDPAFNPGYSQFCYELPYMPAQTSYLDTPVVPTSAFSEGYNHPDCAYPALTPSIKEVDGDGKGPWVANAGGAVNSVTVTNGGSYTTSGPSVTFTAPSTAGGVTATGTVTLAPSGSVASVTITRGGSGYKSTPNVSFGAPNAGTTATGVAVVSGYVTNVTITKGGTYALAPTVTFSAPQAGGTTATGTVVFARRGLTGTVTGVTINNPGSGYVTAPTVTFSASGLGSANTATGTSAITEAVTAINIVNPGSGYTTAPVVSITGGSPTTNAAATSALGQKVTAVNITNSGSGYTAAPTVSFTGGAGPGGAAAQATIGSGGILTIYAQGDTQVINNAYSGPSASAAPFNAKTINRHYGFGSQCTAVGGACTAVSSVTIGNKTAPIIDWNDSTIHVLVPGGVANCPVQQQKQYSNGATTAQCGQLVITSGTGQQSVDAVTVTIGGKAPTHVTTNTSTGVFGSIQAAIDNALPGDMIMVDPGVYYEMLVMWKPVRLQGVGAVTSVINANTQPAGKLDPWRARVTCLFGLSLNGQPATGFSTGANGSTVYSNAPSSTNSNPYDPTGNYTCGGWPGFTGVENDPQVDRLPLEGMLGWDTTVNGNLAQLLQEPTLLGAYEGAGITVLSKGVKVPANSGSSYYGSGAEATFPTGTQNLTAADCSSGPNGTNPYPSSFQCNPSSIDGLSVTDSSQGGGGIFVHAWGHNLQIANNRVYNNIGTLSGGINIGQGESPDAYLQGATNDTDPGSCISTNNPNQQLPYCFDLNVNVHNNWVALNTSIGDELFSGTPAGAGGVTFCTGADYYKFQYNWVCGNMSTGDGGGFAHLGFIWNGDIEHNSILFNQSTNPTIQTNGGGIVVIGAAPDGAPPGSPAGTECGGTIADADCTPGLPDGTGPGLVINANLIQGNGAESGSGGGIRLQSVNGTDIGDVPLQPNLWNSVSLTNNIIVNNVAGWDGAGISLQDALNVNIINNTVASNDATASAGPLFNTLGSPLASAPNPSMSQQITASTVSSRPQVAGIVSMGNSPQLLAGMPASVFCPAGHSVGSLTAPVFNGSCKTVSYPLMANNMIWQNRSFSISTGGYGNTYQQNQIALSPMLSQATTGQCVNGANYWDVGVRGDLGPNDHSSGVTLSPVYSFLSSVAGYTSTGYTGAAANSNNSAANPEVISQYCNGSRVPPENGGLGYAVPPGISDATVPNPIFNLTPAATVDEGNNWVNISWGPLATTNPVTGATLGNYAPTPYSQTVGYVPTNTTFNALVQAPATDFFGNPRAVTGNTNHFGVGAVELQSAKSTSASIAPMSVAFGDVTVGTTSVPQTLTLYAGNTAMRGITATATAPFAVTANSCPTGINTLAAGASCTISVVFSPTTVPANNVATTGTLTIGATAGGPVAGSPVPLTGYSVAQISVSPGQLNFGNVNVNTAATVQTVTVTNGTTTAVNNLGIVFGGGDFTRSGGTCGAALQANSSCTIGVKFTPSIVGVDQGSLSISAQQGNGSYISVVGGPVTLNGVGLGASVSPASLSFGNVIQGQASAPQTIVVSNTQTTALTVAIAGVTSTTTPFKVTSVTPTTCGAVTATSFTVAATTTPSTPGTCSFSVTYNPLSSATPGTAQNGTMTLTGKYGAATTTVFAPVNYYGTAYTNGQVTMTGTPTGAPAKPNLAVLDNFNRGTVSSLGTNWLETTSQSGRDLLQVSGNQAVCSSTSGCTATISGSALWNAIDPVSGVGVIYGAKQGAAYTLTNNNIGTDALILDATGLPAATNPALLTNFVRVIITNNGATHTYNAIVQVTTNNGASYTTIGTFPITGTGANWVSGDTITALLDSTTAMGSPTVSVWRTRGTTDQYLGSAQIPVNVISQVGGQIGIQLTGGSTIDNFAGGNVQ